jgi:hypothetical protein
MIAFLILAAEPSFFAARDTYKSCIAEQAVSLGRGNAEPADNVVRAARSNCLPQWTALNLAYPGPVGGSSGDDQMRAGMLARWHQEAEDAAIAALLAARAKRP